MKSGNGPYAGVRRGPCPEIPGSPKFRSSWERNVYRILLRLHKTVEYEPARYVFEKPYRRHLDYLPDFLVDRGLPSERFVEVKGWLDGSSKSKLLGFKKYYPDQARRLLVVTGSGGNVVWVVKNLQCFVWDYPKLKGQVAGHVLWE